MRGRRDSANRRGRFAPSVLLAFLLPLSAFLGGQEPPLSDADSRIAAIEAKIRETEASQQIDEKLKKELLDVYQGAVTHLKAYRKHGADLATVEARAQEAKEAASEAPEKPAPPPEAAALKEELRTADLPELENRLTKRKEELDSFKSQATEKSQKIAEEENRPQTLRDELARAKDWLRQITAASAAPPDAGENPILRQARQDLLRARELARTKEIQKLERERATYEERLGFLKTERDRAEREGAAAAREVQTLEELILTKRKEVVAEEQKKTEEARVSTQGKDRALVNIADENKRLIDRLANLTELDGRVTREIQDVTKQLDTARKDFATARRQLEKVGLSAVLAEIFLEQREDLPRLDGYRKRSADRKQEFVRLREQEVKIEETKRWLASMEEAVLQTVESADPPLSPEEVPEFEARARALLTAQAGLIDKLEETYERYLPKLGELDFLESDLAREYQQYASFLDEHLLWIPSADPLGVRTFTALFRAVSWLASPADWNTALRVQWDALTEHVVLTLLVGLAILGLIASRRWWRRRLRVWGEGVGKKDTDSYLLTPGALVATAAIAAPVPLLVWFLGWALVDMWYAPEFSRAVGHGLMSAGSMLFVLLAARLFCDPDGVARVHFKWSEKKLAVVRRHIVWLTGLGIPLLFLVAMTEPAADKAYQDTLGRLAFLAAMVMLAVFAARVLSPGTGVLAKALTTDPNSWGFRLRFAWYACAVGAPLAIAVLAGLGYYYTALQLDHRVVWTVLTIVGGIIAYHLIARSLLIARKRLAIARARERREAELAARAEQDGGDVTVEIDAPEIDLPTIKKQTQGVFRTAIFLAVAVSVVAAWADVLPALGVFDRELWQVRVFQGGEETFRSVTIGSLFLFALTCLLTFVSARSLPGILEVSAVRKLPLDPGSRYAFSTIGQYLIVAVGLILAFRIIGVGWSHIQWLVAALGVGLGFGLQEIFANFVSGVIILLERPIRVGDTVTIGDVSGTVSRIRIRATTIIDWDQKELVVPNKSFITGQLVNWSLSNPVTRLIVNVGIAYGSDTELALRLMLQVAKDNPKVLEEPEPCVFFVGFGDSSLNFEVRVFVKELSNRARTRITHEIHMGIDRAFREHGVVIAFPQRDIHIKDDERLTTGLPPYSDELDARAST